MLIKGMLDKFSVLSFLSAHFIILPLGGSIPQIELLHTPWSDGFFLPLLKPTPCSFKYETTEAWPLSLWWYYVWYRMLVCNVSRPKWSFIWRMKPAADAWNIKLSPAEIGVESTLLCFYNIYISAINTSVLRVLQTVHAPVIWMLKRPFKQERCCVCWRGGGQHGISTFF